MEYRSGEKSKVHTSFKRSIQELRPGDVLEIGAIDKGIVRLWTREVARNRLVVLTGERRRHYLTEHPEMFDWEHLLIDALLDPDEVHRNRKDQRIAIFYKRVRPTRYLRVAVLMQEKRGAFKHSVMSCRFARHREIQNGRRYGRKVWKRE